jgi:predicted  nucleic acid-binding Zn-ribbon protein
MNIARSLADLGNRLARARQDLRIAEEQLLFQSDVVEDARTRMLVSETPLAERDFRTARDDLERLDRQRSRLFAEIADLQREQDRLLDRMIAPRT